MQQHGGAFRRGSHLNPVRLGLCWGGMGVHALTWAFCSYGMSACERLMGVAKGLEAVWWGVSVVSAMQYYLPRAEYNFGQCRVFNTKLVWGRCLYLL